MKFLVTLRSGSNRIRMKSLIIIVPTILGIFELCLCEILFDGSASLGKSKVWKNYNLDGEGTQIQAVDDAQLGKVWEFTKPQGAHRCEGHGVKGYQAKEGDDIYIGWSLQLNLSPEDLTTNANFQWKAYPKDQQNYPVVLKTIKGKIVLEQYNPGKKRSTLWSTEFQNGQWNSIVLRIKVSKNIKKGFLQFWFKGEPVTFSNNGKTKFTCRTFDGDKVDPKWGVYGGDDGDVINRVGSIKIATTLEEAQPQ